MEIAGAGVSARTLAHRVPGNHLDWVGVGLPPDGHWEPLGTGRGQYRVGMDADSWAGMDDEDPDGGRVEGVGCSEESGTFLAGLECRGQLRLTVVLGYGCQGTLGARVSTSMVPIVATNS